MKEGSGTFLSLCLFFLSVSFTSSERMDLHGRTGPSFVLSNVAGSTSFARTLDFELIIILVGRCGQMAAKTRSGLVMMGSTGCNITVFSCVSYRVWLLVSVLFCDIHLMLGSF
jgi:hypothetical protein